MIFVHFVYCKNRQIWYNNTCKEDMQKNNMKRREKMKVEKKYKELANKKEKKC